MTYGSGAPTVLATTLLQQSPLVATFDTELNFKKIYDFIRWHHDYVPLQNPGEEYIDIFPYAQVPEGITASELTWPSHDPTDDLYTLYRRPGLFEMIVTNGSALEDI
jgi:hypothetical protein